MSEEPKLWVVSFAIDGSGFATVRANSEEEAQAKFDAGEFVESPEIGEWDINTAGYRGGYLEFQED